MELWAFLCALLLVNVSGGPVATCTSVPVSEPTSPVRREYSGEQQTAAPVWGIADTHAHQFANLGAGGDLFWGEPFSPRGDFKSGMAYALADCTPAHGRRGTMDWIGNFMHDMFGGRLKTEKSFVLNGHSTQGYPDFDGWPKWDTRSHQQMYVSWLLRAYQGGLRLMVMHTVNSEGLCRLAIVRHKTPCDDETATQLQLDGARRLVRYIDQQSGGPGRGWYRIVESPAEARKVIQAGKLAVVLGVEADNIFGCSARAPCTGDQVRSGLDRYYRKGVRHIFPIHLTDNAFGGYALYNVMVDVNNKRLTGRFPRAEICKDRSLTYHMATPMVAAALLTGETPNYPRPGKGPHCNRLGLTNMGDTLILEMMKRGMIIDVDHMSRKAVTQTLDKTSAEGYPVISGHTGFSDISIGQHNHEGQKTASQIATIQKNHGMVSVIFVQGSTEETAQWIDPTLGIAVTNDCSNSSKTWAQAYLYAVSKLGGFEKAAVGMASDQMLNEWFGPRFGPDACRGPENVDERPVRYTSGPAGKRTEYPTSQTDPVLYPVSLDSALRAHSVFAGIERFGPDRANTRTFDFNTMGMAHIGLLPDFLRDLRNEGLTGNRLDPLFRSAEAYIEMWECAELQANRISSGKEKPVGKDLCEINHDPPVPTVPRP